MNVQNKKKATIGVAIAAVGAAAIALGAGTFASFSSTQTGPDTTLAAGKLDFGAPSSTELPTGPFAPGDKKSRTMTFTNSSNSSLNGTVNLAFTLKDNLENNCTGDESLVDTTCGTPGAGDGELQDKLVVTVTGGDANYTGPLSGLTTLSTPNVAPGQSVTYTFEFNLPNTADAPGVVNPDNAVQGDTVTLVTTATLKQL